MNTYRIEYRYYNGFSNTVFIQAANRIAAYKVCEDILPNLDKIVSLRCELEKEEEQDEFL